MRVTNLLASGIAGARDWGAAIGRLSQEARRDPARKAMKELIGKMRLNDAGDPLALPQPERLSDAPDVIVVRHLFTAMECDYLARLAAPGFTPSVVNDAAGRQVRDPIRTSDGSTLHWLIENPAVHALNRRLAAATGTDAGQGEAVQILRYRPGEQYRPHFDFVRASDNQRMMTALIYLNHDYEGGETCFVKTGLKVKGRKGDALIFRSATPDRELDPLSEHAGLPVTKGVKLLASRWIREKRWAP
jgi:prolyl 4-hydroxylase